MDKARAYTKEEVREMFIKKMLGIAKYWSEVDGSREWICEGVVHSMFAEIDGCGLSFPAMDMVLRPHDEDKEYYIENEENWFENGMAINDDTMLHEQLHRYKD